MTYFKITKRKMYLKNFQKSQNSEISVSVKLVDMTFERIRNFDAAFKNMIFSLHMSSINKIQSLSNFEL